MARIRQFESGDLVSATGVYRSGHARCQVKDLWLRHGERFPVCAQCGLSSTYVLDTTVEHISDDPDFQ